MEAHRVPPTPVEKHPLVLDQYPREPSDVSHQETREQQLREQPEPAPRRCRMGGAVEEQNGYEEGPLAHVEADGGHSGEHDAEGGDGGAESRQVVGHDECLEGVHLGELRCACWLFVIIASTVSSRKLESCGE